MEKGWANFYSWGHIGFQNWKKKITMVFVYGMELFFEADSSNNEEMDKIQLFYDLLSI